MLIGLSLFAIIGSFFLAKLEIQIEGKNGWASDLPTWRKKSRILSVIFGEYILTGYHTWLFSFVIIFLNFPFFIGFPWSFSAELQILSIFFFSVPVEDAFWVLLNPNYGLKKFNKEHIIWHRKWIGIMPFCYLSYYLIGLALLLLSYLF